jgi:hypothetical protein
MSKKRNNRVFKCAIELDNIAKTKSPAKRKILISKAKNCVIDSISEIALNCLNGNFPVKNCDFKKLKGNKAILRKLAQKFPSKFPIEQRRKIIIQRGGFLQIVIPAALSYLGSLTADYLYKKFGNK